MEDIYSYSNKQRLIVTHNTKRAEKDRKDREKSIEKLRKKLENRYSKIISHESASSKCKARNSRK